MLTSSVQPTTRPVAPAKKGFPRFVMRTMEMVRSLSTRDGVIRITIDTTSSVAVCFHAHWLISSGKTRSIERRVFVEAKLNANGLCNAVYMARPFDEDATVIEYELNDLDLLAKDIQAYLSSGKLPE
jgi:hypothetical protein